MAILLHSAIAGSSVTLFPVRHHHAAAAAATALTFSSWWPLKFNDRSRPRSLNSLLCFASSGDRPPSVQISATAKIRNEVLSPFRTVRMFLYLAFAASGALGGLIALTRLIAQLKNAAANSEAVTEIVIGLGIDLAAVSIFAFLYLTEQKAQKAQLAKLSREETLATLKMETRAKKVVSVAELRGVARLVIVAGSASFIQDSFRLSKPFTEALLERGVRVLYFATDGLKPELEGSSSSSSDSNQNDSEESLKRLKSLWQLTPLYTSEWSKWLNEQKSLANVGESLPIYISLRMDGRVRGSGVGYPPWNAFVAQLPPLKGIWVGVLDGMDGRV